MRVVIFCHSLLSDWNHGNAHFLRGITTELQCRGHDVSVYEPRDSWSLKNLLAECGPEALSGFHGAYPNLRSNQYDIATLDLNDVLQDADLVLVHEWNEPKLVAAIGRHHVRAGCNYRLLFHDTHHRAVSAPAQMGVYDLSGYDGVLAFGTVIRDLYRQRGWARQAWTWHEAADTRIFRPRASQRSQGDLVWIGNWGDEERTRELEEFLIEPVTRLGLKARVYGVRYPDHALRALANAGIEYAGWLPNYRVPDVFAGFKVTVHIPRRPYASALPGIPTIRVFEALACGVPLVTAPWQDVEGLFAAGEDFLVAQNGSEMKYLLRLLLDNQELARSLACCGWRTILARHTCRLRVDELLSIHAGLETTSRLPCASEEGQERMVPV